MLSIKTAMTTPIQNICFLANNEITDHNIPLLKTLNRFERKRKSL